MRLGLAVYSFTEARGDAYALMDRAAAAGLCGVEFPAEDSLPATTPHELAKARAFAAERGLGIAADGGVIDEAALRRWIPQARTLGAPGVVVTSRAKVQFGRGVDPIKTAEEEKRIPLRRLGTPEDCARIVELLATDLSDYVTGQVICVCGGTVLSPS